MHRNLKYYYDSAQRLKLPLRYIPSIDCLEVYLDKKYLFLPYITPLNNMISLYIAKNKMTCNLLLKKANFPVTNARVVYQKNFSEPYLKDLVEELTFPLVIKPTMNTSGGKDVVCNIKDFNQLYSNLKPLLAIHGAMQIEPFYQQLREYRVLMLNYRVIAVVEQRGAGVRGDGRHSIEELVAFHNRSLKQKSLQSPLELNEMSRVCLQEQGYSIHSCPEKGEFVKLNDVASRALGGTVISLNKNIPLVNSEYLTRAARKLGLALVSFDLLCEDIYRSFDESQWIILEANFDPDIALYEAPDFGLKINVSKKILKSLIYQHPVAYLYGRLKAVFTGGRGPCFKLEQ